MTHIKSHPIELGESSILKKLEKLFKVAEEKNNLYDLSNGITSISATISERDCAGIRLSRYYGGRYSLHYQTFVPSKSRWFTTHSFVFNVDAKYVDVVYASYYYNPEREDPQILSFESDGDYNSLAVFLENQIGVLNGLIEAGFSSEMR